MQKILNKLPYKKILNRQFILYTIIGLSGVLLDFIIYAFLTQVFHINPIVANTISISAGIINNFILNLKFNFKVTDKLLKRFSIFYLVGFFGIMLSAALLAFLHYIVGINELLAKLITLPVILLAQYTLNKNLSFGNLEKVERQLKVRLFHWPLFVLAAVYVAVSLLMITSIPKPIDEISATKGGPDELAHYSFNVEFIMKKKRLPVSGVDDLDAYKNCRDEPFSSVPCLYSYSIYPAPSYIVSAVSAKVFSASGRITPFIAARIPTLLYGLVFVLSVYGASYVLTRRRLVAGLLTFSVAFIPQVIFTNSYTNLDAHSLAISGLLAFSFALFALKPQDIKRQIFLTISLFGLLPLAKYNYFILGVAALSVIVYILRRYKFTRKELLRMALFAVGSFILFSAFWYIRNLLLYGDALGQNFVLEKMSEFHQLGQTHPFNLDSFVRITHMNYFDILFRSFFVAYGSMFYFLEEHVYIIIKALLIMATSAFFYLIYVNKNKSDSKKILIASSLFSAVFMGCLLLGIYNTFQYDFQPQGRYMYPILAPLVLLVAYAIRKDKQMIAVLFILAGIAAFTFIEGAGLFVKVYMDFL